MATIDEALCRRVANIPNIPMMESINGMIFHGERIENVAGASMQSRMQSVGLDQHDKRMMTAMGMDAEKSTTCRDVSFEKYVTKVEEMIQANRRFLGNLLFFVKRVTQPQLTFVKMVKNLEEFVMNAPKHLRPIHDDGCPPPLAHADLPTVGKRRADESPVGGEYRHEKYRVPEKGGKGLTEQHAGHARDRDPSEEAPQRAVGEFMLGPRFSLDEWALYWQRQSGDEPACLYDERVYVDDIRNLTALQAARVIHDIHLARDEMQTCHRAWREVERILDRMCLRHRVAEEFQIREDIMILIPDYPTNVHMCKPHEVSQIGPAILRAIAWGTEGHAELKEAVELKFGHGSPRRIGIAQHDVTRRLSEVAAKARRHVSDMSTNLFGQNMRDWGERERRSAPGIVADFVTFSHWG
jgi:hypothetical protein